MFLRNSCFFVLLTRIDWTLFTITVRFVNGTFDKLLTVKQRETSQKSQNETRRRKFHLCENVFFLYFCTVEKKIQHKKHSNFKESALTPTRDEKNETKHNGEEGKICKKKWKEWRRDNNHVWTYKESQKWNTHSMRERERERSTHLENWKHSNKIQTKIFFILDGIFLFLLLLFFISCDFEAKKWGRELWALRSVWRQSIEWGECIGKQNCLGSWDKMRCVAPYPVYVCVLLSFVLRSIPATVPALCYVFILKMCFLSLRSLDDSFTCFSPTLFSLFFFFSFVCLTLLLLYFSLPLFLPFFLFFFFAFFHSHSSLFIPLFRVREFFFWASQFHEKE